MLIPIKKEREHARRRCCVQQPAELPLPEQIGQPVLYIPTTYCQRRPVAYWSEYKKRQPLQLGAIDIQCRYCNALHWLAKRDQGSSRQSPSFYKCCLGGLVRLELIPKPPSYLVQLLSDLSDCDTVHFRTNIRCYNGALTFIICSVWHRQPIEWIRTILNPQLANASLGPTFR